MNDVMRCLRCTDPTQLKAVDLCKECFQVLGPTTSKAPVVCVICGDKWGNDRTTICNECIGELKIENVLPV